jgi:WD40 repeat protein
MSDYQEAIQNPATCFSDPVLKAGTPALNALGLPTPVTGGFCSVYQVSSGKTRWAVRCFLHNIKDLRDRYAKISGFLRWKRLKQMVGFDYVPEGIKVRGVWHPVLKMEWVDGDTLNSWVDRHVQDAKALRRLDDRWAELMDALEKAQIGHCDLQHGNVLVDGSGHLRLIDYDGMYVPPLRGRGSHEKGHPAYQHPQRDGKDFDERVDRFPALVVHTSLVALAEDPGLWKRHYDDDNLLFKRADFVDPDASPVFRELAKMGGIVADRAKRLREACKRRVSDTPRLREVRSGAAGAAPARRGLFFFPLARRSRVKPEQNGAQHAEAAPVEALEVRKVSGGGTVTVPRTTAAASANAPRASAPHAAAPPRLVPAPASKANAAPAPTAARAGTAPAAARASAPPAAKPAPAKPAPARVAPLKPAAAPPVPAARPAAAKAGIAAPPARPGSQPARTPTQRASGSGWGIEWTRPGEMPEDHVWKLPVYGTREVPRQFLGLTLGTRLEKFVERHDEKLEEKGVLVGGHRSAVTSLAFTSDARLLASGSRDGSVRVWDVQTGLEEVAPLEAQSGVVSLATVPGHSIVAVVLEDRRLVLWDYGPRRRVVHLEAPERAALRAVAASPDGRWVAAGGARRAIHVWQVSDAAPMGDCRPTTGRVESLAFTGDSAGLVCGTSKGRLELFDRASGQVRWSVRPGFGKVSLLAAPARSGSVVGAGTGGTLARWDLRDGSEQQRLRPLTERLTSLSASSDGSHVLVGSVAGKACLYEPVASREVALLDGHAGPVRAVALPATGRLAATGATDGAVCLWSVR